MANNQFPAIKSRLKARAKHRARNPMVFSLILPKMKGRSLVYTWFSNMASLLKPSSSALASTIEIVFFLLCSYEPSSFLWRFCPHFGMLHWTSQTSWVGNWWKGLGFDHMIPEKNLVHYSGLHMGNKSDFEICQRFIIRRRSLILRTPT